MAEWKVLKNQFFKHLITCMAEWKEIKETDPLQFMPYLEEKFFQQIGICLTGLGACSQWIKPGSLYHRQVCEQGLVNRCPHLEGLPIPPPQALPTMQALEGHQKALAKDVEAARKAASDSIERLGQREDAYAANLRAQGKDETIAHLAKPEDPALMEVASQTASGSGDAPAASWADQSEYADSFQRQSTKKRKRSDPKRPDSRGQTKEPGRPLYPFPLQEDARRRVEAQRCYTFSGNLGASLNEFATAAFKKTHPNHPDKEVACITNQVLCMIVEYHLRCASCGPIMTSPVVPAEVEQLLSPLEEYLSDEDGVEAAYTRDLREFERSRTMRVAVWLHRIDMEASSG